MFIRYINKLGQIVDQQVITEFALDALTQIRANFGEADLICKVDDIEYCIL